MAAGVLPEPGTDLMGEEAEAGVDPGHGRIQLDMVVLQPEGVALEGGHPRQQEGVHHVVLGPVVVVDQPNDGGKGAAERRRLLGIAGRQGVHGAEQALAVGPHRLVHGHQHAAVLRGRDGRDAGRLGVGHGGTSMPGRVRTWLPCPGPHNHPCEEILPRPGWQGYQASPLVDPGAGPLVSPG